MLSRAPCYFDHYSIRSSTMTSGMSHNAEKKSDLPFWRTGFAWKLLRESSGHALRSRGSHA